MCIEVCNSLVYDDSDDYYEGYYDKVEGHPEHDYGTCYENRECRLAGLKGSW